MTTNDILIISKNDLRELLSEFANEILGHKKAEAEQKKEFVYGLDGIARLFEVSRVTAQRYKDTFLAPAVSQRGRKIVTDKNLAMELFQKHQNA